MCHTCLSGWQVRQAFQFGIEFLMHNTGLTFQLYVRKSMSNRKKKISTKKTATSVVEVRQEPIFTQGFFRRHWLPCLIIFGSALALYLQTLPYEHVLDDQIVIKGNQYTQKGFQGIWPLLTEESFAGYFGEQKDLLPGARYRPLSLVTFAIEHQIFGLNPLVGHLVNVLLYGFLCVLLFRVFKELLPDSNNEKWFLSMAFLSVLFYTIHPLHTEAVANIKGRDELMAMLFSVLTLYSAIRYVDNGKILTLVGTSLLFFLGLLAKENTLTFLAVIPLTLYFFTKTSLRTILKVVGVLLVVSIIYLVIRVGVIGYLMDSGKELKDIMNNPFVEMKAGEKYATIMYTLGLYVKMHLFPHPLTHDYYPFQIPTQQWTSWRSLLSLLLYIVMGLTSVWGMLSKKVWAYGILFYLTTLSIASNIFFTVGTTMNERFVFMASYGLMIVLAYFISSLLKSDTKVKTYFGFGLIGLFIVGFIVKDIERIPVWRNAVTLNEAAVKVSTNSARANSFMSTALYNKVRDEEMTSAAKVDLLKQADFYADRALAIMPKYKNANTMKAGTVSELYKFDNDLDKLLIGFKKVATNRPDLSFLHEYFSYLNSTSYIDKNKLINFYYDMGYNELYTKQRKYDWAIKYLTNAHNLNTQNKAINEALSKAYAAFGNADKSLYHAELAKAAGG